VSISNFLEFGYYHINHLSFTKEVKYIKMSDKAAKLSTS